MTGGSYKSSLDDLLKEELAYELYKCNHTTLHKPPPENGLYCPAIFDGWSCFDHTKAGTTAYTNCPNFPGFNTNQKAHRDCGLDGTWTIHEKSGKPWTNTSGCLINTTIHDQDAMDQEHIHIYVYVALASLSLILLITSLVIFCGFKQLRCDRVIIHQNLFISLVFTAICYIFYYTLVSLDGTVLIENPIWCQVLHVLCQYFTVCNFSWMFSENLYLNIIMAWAMTTGKTLIKIIIACAWGVPVLITLVYATVKAYALDEARECWAHQYSAVMKIISVPIYISLGLNIIMLIRLVWLLVTKLQQTSEASQTRKAIKAVLILIPLFGLQFLVFPVRPDPNTDANTVYLFVMAILTSTQGTFVSIVFCFCNGEVISLLRRKWHQHILMFRRSTRSHAFTSSTYADPYSVVDTTREGNHSIKGHRIATDVHGKDGMELKPLTAPLDNEKPVNDKDHVIV